jgi:pilus assembly protein FimV
MAIKEGEQLLDDEEITLSSSELDDVLSSAEIDEPDAGREEGSLEQYGVWVKVKPEDLRPGEEGREDFGLADFDSEEDAELTPEEEELLGELEDETVGGGEFEGLDADLEELGRSVEAEPSGFDSGLEEQEEELSVEDLDVDLESLDLERPLDQPGGDLEPLPDLEEPGSGLDTLEDLSLDQEESEIEFPLSERAAVEEHFTALPGAGEPAAGDSSSNLLEKIETDLQQIKSEIQTLKRELGALGRGAPAGRPEIQPVPGAPPGFFNQEEDETIALTGDELDNILNTADITEETAVPILEDLEELVDEAPADLDLGADIEEAEAIPPAEAPTPSLEETEDILDLGSLTLEEPGTSEDLEDIEIDIGGAGEDALGFAEEEHAAEADLDTLESPEDTGLDLGSDLAGSGAEEELILEDLGEATEPGEELLLEEAGAESAEVDELTLGDETGGEEPGLEELALDDLGVAEVESLEEPAELAAELEDFAGEAGAPEPGSADTGLEEFTLEEEELEAGGFEELGAVESDEELLSLEEVEDVEGLEEPGQEMETPETLAEEPLEVEELSLDDAELPAELTGEELDEEIPEIEAEEELPSAPSAGTGGGGALSGDLKKDVRSVLEYLDQLLEALPDDKIQEFARSEYFGIYQRLFDELGLRA